MATDRLLTWFEKRRRSKTLQLAQRHITLAVDTVNELETLVNAFAKKDSKGLEASMDRLFKEEAEIDGLRRTIMEELSRGELPASYREDLKGLILRLDEVADRVKDSARSVRVLMDVALPPESIIDSYIRISRALSRSVKALRASIEALGFSVEGVKSAAQEVDRLEAEIDDEYLVTKLLIVKHSVELDAAAVMALRDLVEYLEQASDAILRTSDYVRILAAGGLESTPS